MSARKRTGTRLATFALACGVLFTTALCLGAQVKPWGEAAAPELKFDTLQGARFDNAGLAGKVTVVNFWAVWCAPCREELPVLGRLAASQGRAVEFLLVNTGDSNTAIAKFLDKSPTTLRSLRQPAGAQDFRFATLPSTVIFDANGRPRWVVSGVVDAQGEPVRSLVANLQAEVRAEAPAPVPVASATPAAEAKAGKPRARPATVAMRQDKP